MEDNFSGIGGSGSGCTHNFFGFGVRLVSFNNFLYFFLLSKKKKKPSSMNTQHTTPFLPPKAKPAKKASSNQSTVWDVFQKFKPIDPIDPKAQCNYCLKHGWDYKRHFSSLSHCILISNG